MWKQNLWNGWLIEAYYSEFIHDNSSEYADYIATSENPSIIQNTGKWVWIWLFHIVNTVL